jgi:hypothetical protein
LSIDNFLKFLKFFIMTWNDIVSFSILSYYDSKLKAWIKALKASAS